MSSDLGEGDKLNWAAASATGPSDLDLTAPDVDIVDMFIGIVHLWDGTTRTGAHPAERILFASPVSPYGNLHLVTSKDHDRPTDESCRRPADGRGNYQDNHRSMGK